MQRFKKIFLMELTSKKKLYSIFIPKVLLDRKVVDVSFWRLATSRKIETGLADVVRDIQSYPLLFQGSISNLIG